MTTKRYCKNNSNSPWTHEFRNIWVILQRLQVF